MTPDEIRELNETLQVKGLKTGSVAAHEAGLKSLELSLLAEIAAQLAEANESLKCIAHPLLTVAGVEDGECAFCHQPATPKNHLRDQGSLVRSQFLKLKPKPKKK